MTNFLTYPHPCSFSNVKPGSNGSRLLQQLQLPNIFQIAQSLFYKCTLLVLVKLCSSTALTATEAETDSEIGTDKMVTVLNVFSVSVQCEHLRTILYMPFFYQSRSLIVLSFSYYMYCFCSTEDTKLLLERNISSIDHCTNHMHWINVVILSGHVLLK